ncbi:galactose oxidase-like domain-containing protein [Cryptosporangium sp. NPDC048952]|uniref:galactose oxidase-like domain-containing protein n=1 Tax=Cryptosporangium sp. NPDC048952 TaxID=3363961 RepID=UPI003715DB1F
MSPRKKPSLGRRLVTLVTSAGVIAVLAIVNRPMVAFGQEQYHQFQINRDSYKSEFGHWDMLPVPSNFQVNAIHAALLPTGKVLIIAGSGNKEDQFKAGTFKTLIWDPKTNHFKIVTTPTDIFCAGHSFLTNGNLLVAGGTKKYELLENKVTHAAGVLKIKQESPDSGTTELDKGTIVTSKTGVKYKLTSDVKVPAAKKVSVHADTTVTPSEVEVWIEAVDKGKGSVIPKPTQFDIEGLTGDDKTTMYGIAEKLTMEKQEYTGAEYSYEFNPFTEKYERVGNLNEPRWYPTLIPTADNKVLALSGLDQFGRIDTGKTEVYNETTKKWEFQPKLNRYFPTYPSVFLMQNEKLFYSGSNAGYGSDKQGRDPGVWDLKTNKFTKVSGLRQPEMNETSASVLLAPAQDQKVMVLGGGGVGEDPKSTARTDIIDLKEATPTFTPGPDLPAPTRYLGTVLLPDDTLYTGHGSSGYRGKGNSDHLTAQIYHPDTNKFTKAADPTVGRNYHSESMLLPDGRVITLGSDPLYDKSDKNPGTFEKRIEIFTPAYLYHGERPSITDGPKSVQRGKAYTFATPDAGNVATARLMRPSTVTHSTDVEQRSIALDVSKTADGIGVTIPKERGLVPSGWYMLFVTNADGTPSEAKWVQVQ